jgi:hypothetical protein
MSLATLDAINKAKEKALKEKQEAEKKVLVEPKEESVEKKPSVVVEKKPTETVDAKPVEKVAVEKPVETSTGLVETKDDVDWEHKYKELEAKMKRQAQASAKQLDDVQKKAATRVLEQQRINESLTKEVDHWKNQVKERDAFDFGSNDTFNHQFKFVGANTMFGKNWKNPFKNLDREGARVDIHLRALHPAFDFIASLKGREVQISKNFKTKISPENSFYRGTGDQPNRRALVYFVMMTFAYQFNLDDLVKYAWYWVKAEHTELASKPDAIRELVQGSESNGSKAFDFYVLALAYRDVCEEKRRYELSENEISTQLYDLRDMIDKQAELSRTIRDGVLTDELLTALLVGRELGIHNHALRSGLKPSDLKEYLAARVPDTETEIARTIMHEAKSYASEVARRDAKAGK